MRLCIIPARGGSKRIPKKNIKPFCGKPIIAYSIETARQSELFDEVIVSTDDESIAEVARTFGANVPFLRPKALADDLTSVAEVIDDTCARLHAKGYAIEYLCTIYATAPFLKIRYLQEGLEKLLASDVKMTFSATSMPYPIQRSFAITPEGRCQMFTPEYFHCRSQDLTPAYHDAGQFYWERRDRPFRDLPFGHDSIPIVLPRFLVQDIDTPEDWERAELMFEAYGKKGC